MTDITLFRIHDGIATELSGGTTDMEKLLQTTIEKNLETLLGIRFLASEYITGKTHGGRIDTLGLDENHCPVILEYKRQVGENVINQGLFYLDWLMDHKAEFKLLVMTTLGQDAADQIDWSTPRLVCIASDFKRYDSYAVQQIDRNIDLIRYLRFGNELLLLELLNAPTAQAGRSLNGSRSGKLVASAPDVTLLDKDAGADRTVAAQLAALPESLAALMASLEDYVFSLGDDIQRKELKRYVAFTRLKNFATLVPQKARLLLYVHVDVKEVQLPAAIGRDVCQQGHWGTGDMELSLTSANDLELAKPLLKLAYDGKAAAPLLTAKTPC